MELTVLNQLFSICKVRDLSRVNFGKGFWFLSKTDEEISLVCETGAVPPGAVCRDDGWKAFRIKGVLDFSLVGVLSEISAVLAASHIGIFAVSTYNTDYILTKAADFPRALKALAEAGYQISESANPGKPTG